MNSKTIVFIGMFMTLRMLIGVGLAQAPVANDVQNPGGKNVADNTGIVIPAPDSDLMSLNFREIDIRELISALAIKHEINVAMSNEVSGKVSIHLYQVTFDEALAAITLAGGFTYQKHGDLYYVFKPQKSSAPQPEHQKMWVYKLKYVGVEKVQEVLDAFPGMSLIKIHEPSKTVIVQDTPENIAKVETLITYLDAAPKQVMIEAKILEVTLKDDMSLGVNWEKILGDVRLGTVAFSNAKIPTTASDYSVPAMGVFGNIITGTGSRHQFAAAIDALQTKTKVNTLSAPKILAIHGKKARVQVGGQQGYRVTTANQGISTETIEFIDTGTILEITPYISDEGSILLNVQPSIRSATIELGIPVVNATDVSTWLLAKDGETVFIGGLIRDTKTQTRNQVPILGSIPIIGWLFGKSADGIGKSELVVLITSQIVHTEANQMNREAQEKIRKKEENFKKDLERLHKDILDGSF